MTDWRDEHETYAHTESPIITRLQEQIARLTAERDDARREVCQIKGTERFAPYFPFATPRQYADIRDWDCFKEDGK